MDNTGIIISDAVCFHLLKHFYVLDKDYFEKYKNNKPAVKKQLAAPASKFFESFAKNPAVLAEKIKKRLSSETLKEGKNELTFVFDEIAGFDLLSGNNENQYNTTRRINVVLVKKNKTVHLVTVYSGNYAPPLPDINTMDKGTYEISQKFWDTRHIIKLSRIGETESTVLQIHDEINKAWENRYTNHKQAKETIQESLKKANDIKYKQGIDYCNFMLFALDFDKQELQDTTLNFLNKYCNLFEDSNDNLAKTRCLLIQTKFYDLSGFYDKAITVCKAAIKIALRHNYTHELSNLYSAYGFINIRVSDYKTTEDYFLKAIDLRAKLNDTAEMAASYNQLARVSLLRKNTETAESYYLKSIKIREEQKYYEALIWSYTGIAFLYLETKQYDFAKKYFNKIDVVKKQQNIHDLQNDILKNHGLGQINNNLNLFDKAIKYLIKALTLSNKLDVKPLQYKIHYDLYIAYKNLQDTTTALHHFEQFHQIKETVLNEENINKLKQQQIVFAIEKSEKETEIEHLKNIELKKANDEITKQKDQIETIHQELSASIDYAQRIQETALPKTNILIDFISDFFIFFKPKDVVSGDFYWWTHIDNHTIITVADCTGHGVPGAFMSMLGISFLREIVVKEKILDSAEILNRLRKEIIIALNQQGIEGEQKDGMDMSLISINHETGIVQFSGANNPLYIIKSVIARKNNEAISTKNEQIASLPAEVRNDDLNLVARNDEHYFYEIKPDKMPIAIYERMDKFKNHKIQLQKGDQLYLFSDGFADQFGGPKGKKFKYKPFKQLLMDNCQLSMQEQKEILEKSFEEWKGDNEQVDDITILGIKI